MNENYQAMTEGVSQFLNNLGLPQYYEIFVTKGYDMETDLLDLNDDDLDEMKITHTDHRAVLKKQAPKHILTTEYLLYVWLKEHGLDYYFVNFVNGELTDFEDIAKLGLPDENIYDELEILLPGHKKRLCNAVKQLRKKRRSTSPQFQTPVTEGWWGKPEFLQDAKYDFLCVDALLASTKANSFENKRLQFMVDSGSDVVTVRQEILDTLDLELIGPIQSRGVHTSKTKNLYKATLLIGNEELEIEVMGESYDSIGSRVIRHFCHYISGGRHVWLKGDYYDPSMSPTDRITPSRFTTSASPRDMQQKDPEKQQLETKTTTRQHDDTEDNTDTELKQQEICDKTRSSLTSDTDSGEYNPCKRMKMSEDIVQVKVLDTPCSGDTSPSHDCTSQTADLSSSHYLEHSSSSVITPQPSPVPPMISPLSSLSRSPSSEDTLPFQADDDGSSNDSVILISAD